MRRFSEPKTNYILIQKQLDCHLQYLNANLEPVKPDNMAAEAIRRFNGVPSDGCGIDIGGPIKPSGW